MQTFTAEEYLKIDIANSFGLDKLTWNERIEWFDRNEFFLFELLELADEPAMFFAGITAWDEFNRGNPIGYPISLDATASGLQILAAMTGDRSAAAICNVVDNGDRADAYTKVYDKMLNKINDISKIEREDTKRAIMTSLYGSEAIPREVFGSGDLYEIFEETMGEVAPAAWELNKVFLDIWDDQALNYSWVLPDNFHVNIKIMSSTSETVHFDNRPYTITRQVNAPVANGRSLSANTVHSIDGMIVREIVRRCWFDPKQVERIRNIIEGKYRIVDSSTPEDDDMLETLWFNYKRTGYLSARILDYIHTSNIDLIEIEPVKELLNSLPEKPFKVLTVHD